MPPSVWAEHTIINFIFLNPQRWRFGCYSGGGFTVVTTCDGNGVTVRSVVRGSRLVAFVSAWSDSIACFRFWEDSSFAKPLFASLNEVLPSRFLAHPSAKAAATNEIGSLRMTISEDCSSRVAKSCRVSEAGSQANDASCLLSLADPPRLVHCFSASICLGSVQ